MGRRRKDDPRRAGFLAIDKPAGITSHDVVGRVRRALGVQRVGHSGTLDPMATGLLLVGVGWVTRVLRYTGDFPKTYVGRISFGTATDTLDAEGEVVREVPMTIDLGRLEEVLRSFVGEGEQIPPMVSAVKVGGEALHRKARRGEEIPREPRPVKVHSLELLTFDGVVAEVEACVSAGTYVRVLADDIGRALGGAAHLAALRRTRIGPHDVDDADPLDTVSERGEELLRPAADATLGLDRMEVRDADVERILSGRLLPGESVTTPTALVSRDGMLLAVHEPGESAVEVGCVAPREAVYK